MVAGQDHWPVPQFGWHVAGDPQPADARDDDPASHSTNRHSSGARHRGALPEPRGRRALEHPSWPDRAMPSAPHGSVGLSDYSWVCDGARPAARSTSAPPHHALPDRRRECTAWRRGRPGRSVHGPQADATASDIGVALQTWSRPALRVSEVGLTYGSRRSEQTDRTALGGDGNGIVTEVCHPPLNRTILAYGDVPRSLPFGATWMSAWVATANDGVAGTARPRMAATRTPAAIAMMRFTSPPCVVNRRWQCAQARVTRGLPIDYRPLGRTRRCSLPCSASASGWRSSSSSSNARRQARRRHGSPAASRASPRWSRSSPRDDDRRGRRRARGHAGSTRRPAHGRRWCRRRSRTVPGVCLAVRVTDLYMQIDRLLAARDRLGRVTELSVAPADV